jgi:hypothetical protein
VETSGHLIAIVRSAARLEILVHATHPAQDPEQPWNVEHALVLRPFLPNSQPELWEAWNALSAVKAWDAELAESVLAVLQATVPSGDEAGELPALGAEVFPAPAPRATAAHPRAFRGTRHRPPKPPRPQPVDLRPYLLASRHIDQVLDLLPARSPRTGRQPGLEPWFVLHVRPLLAKRPASEINRFAALARALDLQRDEALRATLIGVLLAADSPHRALGWWGHVLAEEPGRRLEVARMVYASGAAAGDPVTDLAVLTGLEPHRRWFFYRGIAAGAAPAYLLSGLRLIDGFPHFLSEEVPAGRDDVEAIVRATIERLGTAAERDSGPEFWTGHLWRLCGEQPALVQLLGLPAFKALIPPAAFWLLRLAASWRWNPESALREAPILLAGAREIAPRAAAVEPAYQLKLVEDVTDMYWWASDEERDDERDLTAAIDRALRFAGRVARPPFAAEPVIGPAAHRLAGLDPPHLDALLAAPDECFAALERACRRENDARLLGRGLEVLSARLPALVTATFAGSPHALFATADTLAALSRESQAGVIAAYQSTALAAETFAGEPLERLVAAVASIVPIRRALRQHLAGDRRLSDAQVRGHHERIVAALDTIRLAAIRQEAERVLAARAHIERIESPTVRHALAMIGEADRNRRQLRRLLIAYFAGDRDWRLRHPETLAWLARHPRLDPAAWLAGITTQGSVEGLGELTLAVETDPLEALKAGTSVGTCLGRGGGFSSSAAAIVLDVNKQVVYARDARGSILGRQLVAISEAGELVCFHPYGHTDALQPLFRTFDRELSSRLGLPLCSDRYEVASILSQDWWDDLHWEVEEGSTSPSHSTSKPSSAIFRS